MFLVAVAQAAYSYMPDVSGFVFEDLKSTGNVRLIRDAEIRNKLYRFCSSHDNLTQYSQISQNIELRYFELSAGVLDDTALRWVQEHWRTAGKSDLEAVRQEAEPSENCGSSPLPTADSTGRRNTLLSLSEMRSVASCPANEGSITPKPTRR